MHTFNASVRERYTDGHEWAGHASVSAYNIVAALRKVASKPETVSGLRAHGLRTTLIIEIRQAPETDPAQSATSEMLSQLEHAHRRCVEIRRLCTDGQLADDEARTLLAYYQDPNPDSLT